MTDTDALEQSISLGRAAKVLGTPKGTMASRLARGLIQVESFTLPELLSLATANRLNRLGMPIAGAAEIAAGLKPQWAELIARRADDVPLFLVVEANPDGDTVFLWDVLEPAATVDRFEGSCIVVNLHTVIVETLEALRTVQPETGRLTSNKSWALQAAPAEPGDLEPA